MTLSRRLVAATTTATLLAALAAAPAAARPPVGTCPTGFGPEPWTLEGAIEYKRVAGMPPEAEQFFASYFAKVDKNGNELVCMRDLPDTPGIPSFATQLADDNAAS